MKKLNLSVKTLRKISITAFVLFFSAQLLIITFNGDFIPSDDQSAYIGIAERCFAERTWYPSESFLYSMYSFAPGYINFLILILKIFGSLKILPYINLAMSAFILFALCDITKRMFSEKAAIICALFYCLTYTNLFIPIGFFTELPFMACMAAAILLSLRAKNSFTALISASLFIALGNWIRPIALAFALGISLFLAAEKKYAQILVFSLFSAIFALCIGFFEKSSCGIFHFQSTTSGINLAGCSHGKANGLVNFEFFDNDPFYAKNLPSDFEELNFYEKDKALRKCAFKYITENPSKYFLCMPLKNAMLFSFDAWSERFSKENSLSKIKTRILTDPKFRNSYILKLFFKSIVFYFSIVLFLIYFIKNIKSVFQKKNVFALVPFFAYFFTIPFMVTDRYHYPMMFFVWIYASSQLSEFLFDNGGKDADSIV